MHMLFITQTMPPSHLEAPEQPGVAVHSDEREPVPARHAVAREVDAEARLRQLRRHLLRRLVYRP